MNARFLRGSEDLRLSGEKTLDDNVENSRPKQVHIDVYLLQMLAKG